MESRKMKAVPKSPRQSPNSTDSRTPACARRLDKLFEQCVSISEKPTFDGTGSWRDFIHRFEDQEIFRSQKPTIELLVCSLRGEAVNTFLSLSKEKSFCYKWVKNQLQQIYEDPDFIRNLHIQLKNRKWYPLTESLTTYRNDVSALSKKVFGSFPASERRKITANYFVAGIEIPEIINALLKQPMYPNINSAFEVAKLALAKLNSTHK